HQARPAPADQPVRDRIAGRPEPDRGQLVDLPGDRRRADLQPQRRQVTEQLDLAPTGAVLAMQPGDRDRVDLTVAPSVDLLAPRPCPLVEPGVALGPRVLVELEWNQ